VSAAYRGRFAPSPTGPLHAGSLVAALASWLDARAHDGVWIVRMEDIDEPRCSRAHGEEILRQLAVFGLASDEPVVWQSSRKPLYQAALDQLIAQNAAYACACSRADIAAHYAERGITKQRFGEWVYPGTCRAGLVARAGREGLGARAGHAWRFKLGFEAKNQTNVVIHAHDTAIKTIADTSQHWHDRRLGAQSQDLGAEVGDFVLKRADGCFAYQLAVVVDDAEQGITDVVRGEDLADNTPRQIALQRALGLVSPLYLHTPLVLGADGHKLSKQNGAAPLDESDPLQTVSAALLALHIRVDKSTLAEALQSAQQEWSLALTR
jgi:glutamyl-Q tRNA(Asp) synthetase